MPKPWRRSKKLRPQRVAAIRTTLAPGTPVEVWFQDEMRVGQKNKLTYRWATKGSRPRAIHDQRTQSTYVFGAVLSRARNRRRPRAAGLQYRSHAASSQQGRYQGHAWRTRHSDPRSSWMARRQRPQSSKQHHTPAAAATLTRTQPARKTFGNSCGRTGCRTVSSNPSTTSSTTAVTPGTPSSTSPGK